MQETTSIPHFFLTIEESGLSMWVRDNPFWAILSVHALGMAILCGASVIVALRLLGIPRDLPLAPLKRLYSYIWVGFWIQVVSGMLLLIGYPTKSLTNLDFYLKLVLIAVGMVVMVMLKKRVFSDPAMSEKDMMLRGRALAIWSLVLWAGVVTSGRMLAYTYTNISYPG
jgi:phosphatidylserine synthase